MATFTRDPHRAELHEDDCPRAGLVNDGDTLGTTCTCPDTMCPCECHEEPISAARLADPLLGGDDCCEWAR